MGEIETKPSFVDEPWWCWVCHGLGGWDEDGAERGDFGDTKYIDCPCCDGDGGHEGSSAPPCHPARQRTEIIEARAERGGQGDAKPWLVYINGEVWRDSRGVGRRFATKEAAVQAARRRTAGKS